MKRTPLRKVSSKQAARNRLLAKLRAELLAEQVEERGYNWCVLCGYCFRPDQLEMDHIEQRAFCGSDERENVRLVCTNYGKGCHDLKHEAPGHRYRQ